VEMSSNLLMDLNTRRTRKRFVAEVARGLDQRLINDKIGQVDPSTQMSGKPTNRELTAADSAPACPCAVSSGTSN